MKKSLSWTEKMLRPSQPEVVVLKKRFAGLEPGKLLLISTPMEIHGYLAGLAPDEPVTVASLRAGLAAQHGADATCPLTTGIFLRILSEAALEQISKGTDPEQVWPFWRLVDPASPLAKKLSCGPAFLRKMRNADTAA